MSITQPELDEVFLVSVKGGEHKLAEEWLVEGANIHANNDAALFEAVLFGSIEMVEMLIKRGANLKAKHPLSKLTPLFNCSRTNALEVIEILLKNGANIDERDSKGETLLHLYCRKHNVEIVSFLINKGARVDIKSYVDDGVTAKELIQSKKHAPEWRNLLTNTKKPVKHKEVNLPRPSSQ